jgi:hypothetical protein
MRGVSCHVQGHVQGHVQDHVQDHVQGHGDPYAALKVAVLIVARQLVLGAACGRSS